MSDSGYDPYHYWDARFARYGFGNRHATGDRSISLDDNRALDAIGSKGLLELLGTISDRKFYGKGDLIDFGIGDGIWSRLVLECYPHLARRMVGVDITDEFEVPLTDEFGERFTFYQADLVEDVFYEGVSGIALLIDVLHHMTDEDVREAFYPVCDALAKDGFLFVTHTPNPDPDYEGPCYFRTLNQVLDAAGPVFGHGRFKLVGSRAFRDKRISMLQQTSKF